jgi:hypothetical protein
MGEIDARVWGQAVDPQTTEENTRKKSAGRYYGQAGKSNSVDMQMRTR